MVLLAPVPLKINVMTFSKSHDIKGITLENIHTTSIVYLLNGTDRHIHLIEMLLACLKIDMRNLKSIDAETCRLRPAVGATFVRTPANHPRKPWWRHQMETFSALLAFCAGNSKVTGEFPAQRPVARSLGVFIDLPPNKRLSKQPWGWWFETPWRSLWRHYNAQRPRRDLRVNGVCLWIRLITDLFYLKQYDKYQAVSTASIDNGGGKETR